MRPPHPFAPGPAVGIDEVLIARVVDSFYAKVRVDTEIGPIFNERIKDWPSHLEKLGSFWSSIMLLSGSYEGTPMQAHLAIPHLSGQHFTCWHRLFRATLAELCTPDQANLFASRAERIGQSFQYAMAIQRGEGPVKQFRPVTSDL